MVFVSWALKMLTMSHWPSCGVFMHNVVPHGGCRAKFLDICIQEWSDFFCPHRRIPVAGQINPKLFRFGLRSPKGIHGV
jgi:hypothetical protein